MRYIVDYISPLIPCRRRDLHEDLRMPVGVKLGFFGDVCVNKALTPCIPCGCLGRCCICLVFLGYIRPDTVQDRLGRVLVVPRRETETLFRGSLVMRGGLGWRGRGSKGACVRACVAVEVRILGKFWEGDEATCPK